MATIDLTSLNTIFTGYKSVFNRGFEGVESQYRSIATVVPSTTRTESYAWLGQVSQIREWIGDRVVNKLQGHDYSITNQLFEQTIEVPRQAIEDDTYGVYAPMMEDMGRAAGEHPDDLVFSLLKEGFTKPCYDGKPFFASDHPVVVDQEATSVSNMQAGAGDAWFLVDNRRAIRPMIYQDRMAFSFTSLTNESDSNVFWKDTYVYGARGRGAAGFGLWQLAFGSQAALTLDNFIAARDAMINIRGESGRKLGIRPTHLFVPLSLEGTARRLIKSGTRVIDSGGTPLAVDNEWKDAVQLVISVHL